MLANYGYSDGSGTYYITLDTDKCNGCGDCVTACPQQMFLVEPDDYDDDKVVIKEAMRKDVKYLCAPCKPTAGPRELPCEATCAPGAIVHSW
ncbi:MAG: 4Fe-4S binding protein [Dehalococcoidia bacterium]|jgi:ferredoxin|nr:4Fe-4S binding protein [Dehalococcoidia bacterium]MDP6782297.1 4Fe-4S binding protein [Dehalococcoidia bacterium]